MTARKAGTTVITATSGKTKRTCRVVVESPKLNAKQINLKVGRTKKLALRGTKQKIRWSSGNRSVAAVSSAGLVTAKKAGICKVYAEVAKKKFPCKVIVTAVKKPAVPEDQEEPADRDEPEDPSDENGEDLTDEDGEIPDAEEPTDSSGDVSDNATFTLSETDLTIDLYEDSSAELTAYYDGKAVNGYAIDWTSTDESVAWISYKTIWAEKVGETTITASYMGKTAQVHVQVIDTEPEPAPVAVKDINYLKNYIKTYGAAASDGTKGIAMNYSGRTFGIMYMESSGLSDKLVFVLKSDKDFLTMDVYTTYSSVGSVMYTFEVSSGYFTAEGNVIASNYHAGDPLNMTITDTDVYGLTDDDVQKLCNTSFEAGMLSWETLLKLKVGMSMKDLGFTSYEP